MASSVKKRLVVGNWKMYVETVESARTLANTLSRRARSFKNTEVWIAPPAPFIPILASSLTRSSIRIGAQTVSSFDTGAHTGEMSARVLKEAGASFVIVGHSERRAMGETDAMVSAALKHAIELGLTIILCVGEHARDEQGGHFEFLSEELRSALVGVVKFPPAAKFIVAYEPIWAIGKSAEEAARPDLVRESAIFIRKTLSELFDRAQALRVPILYGGSVEGANAAALVQGGDINGFLVGRASADAGKLYEIIEACGGTMPHAKTAKGKPKKLPAKRKKSR